MLCVMCVSAGSGFSLSAGLSLSLASAAGLFSWPRTRAEPAKNNEIANRPNAALLRAALTERNPMWLQYRKPCTRFDRTKLRCASLQRFFAGDGACCLNELVDARNGQRGHGNARVVVE